MKRNIYADVIKDVIGNDPVLDQYEFDYTSNYIESAQDDHITGTFISKSASGLSIDARGRSFSTYATPNVNSIGSSAAEISKFPRASARLQSNREVSSTQQLRHSAPLFDDKERWYDSCLPDLFAALQHDGTHVKKLTTEKKVNALELFSGSLITLSDFTTAAAAAGGGQPTVSLKDHTGKDMDALLSLSPMATFTTRSIGFVTFNVPRLNAADDPSINNEWTWAYPYEGKFNPTNRQLSVNDVLNLNLATADVLPALSGALINNIFPPGDNRAPYASAPRNLPHMSYNASTGRSYQVNGGIVPVMHGHHGIKKIVTIIDTPLSTNVNMRDGNRTWNAYDADSYFYPIGETHDEKFGFSTVLMGDTFLNQQNYLGYMRPDANDSLSGSSPDYRTVADSFMFDISNWGTPNFFPIISNITAYTTGSATKSDLVKFFFGFGDVNNMGYARHMLSVESASYTCDIIAQIQGAGVDAIPVGNKTEKNAEIGAAAFQMQLPNLTIGTIDGKYPWRVLQKDLTAGYPDATYHIEAVAATTGPVRWISGSSPSNDKILGSGSPNYVTDPLGNGEDSRMYIDIFSESPWRYRYSRGVVAGDDQSYLKSVAIRVHVHGQSDLHTSSLGNSDISFDLYSAFDSAYAHFLHDVDDGYGEVDYVTGSTALLNLSLPESKWTSNVYPPGLWRLMFLYHNVDTGVGTTDDINRAFISDLKIEVFGKSTFTPDESYKIGCNNYPDFRQKSFDARNCPKDDDYPIHYFSGSLGILGGLNDNDLVTYTNRNRNFRSTYVGLGPVIRGWKHGLVSGFPTYSRATWRRNRFGQLRDMLEQRTYTKFVYDYVSSPLQNIATPAVAPSAVDDKIPVVGQLEPGPVEVNYVRRRYKRDERGIGYVYSEKVDGSMTLSQNISTELTSSVPYVDGVAVLRKESELASVKTSP